MNECGVAHFANAVGGCGWRLGLPQYPLKRLLLEQRSLAQCLELLRGHRTCSAANMVLCDGEGAIADVEIRFDGIALYQEDRPDRRLHTNHYLTPEFAGYQPDPAPDSVLRLRRLRELVDSGWAGLDVEAMKSILADHVGDPGAICRHGEGGSHSIAGYTAEPARGLFHVCRGHGCLGTWHSYEV
ncbi:MAG: C45 family autoproteolytic acyltransferase/hydrolase [Candidatus Latescibacterota bacterium]